MDEFAELIERSTLGTPGAKALRARVSDERVAEVMRRIDEACDDAADRGAPLGKDQPDRHPMTPPQA